MQAGGLNGARQTHPGAHVGGRHLIFLLTDRLTDKSKITEHSLGHHTARHRQCDTQLAEGFAVFLVS